MLRKLLVEYLRPHRTLLLGMNEFTESCSTKNHPARTTVSAGLGQGMKMEIDGIIVQKGIWSDVLAEVSGGAFRQC